jgi:hypothetical protein
MDTGDVGSDRTVIEEASPSSGVDASADIAAADVTQDSAEPQRDAIASQDATTSQDATAAEGATDAPSPPGDAYPATCFDTLKNGDETDIDCGGSCPGCGPHGFCASDSDCSATALGCYVPSGGCFCQYLSHECVGDHCEDFRLDGDETGVDCGGSLCIPCVDGTACKVDRDCISKACDAVALVCIADQCLDHQLDGMESDVDCGGETCARCAVGKKCVVNSDCEPGRACSAAHVCI